MAVVFCFFPTYQEDRSIYKNYTSLSELCVDLDTARDCNLILDGSNRLVGVSRDEILSRDGTNYLQISMSP